MYVLFHRGMDYTLILFSFCDFYGWLRFGSFDWLNEGVFSLKIYSVNSFKFRLILFILWLLSDLSAKFNLWIN